LVSTAFVKPFDNGDENDAAEVRCFGSYYPSTQVFLTSELSSLVPRIVGQNQQIFLNGNETRAG